jgi:deoxyribodipyrimidine photo-lyase
MPGEVGTYSLSAAMKIATLSLRQARDMAQQAIAVVRSDESLESIQIFYQVLALREFCQQALFYYFELAEGPYRPQRKLFPWVERSGALFGLVLRPDRDADH